jgi:tetratricopeptide (TPR) repeat protein
MSRTTMRHSWNLSAVVSLALVLGAASGAHAQPAPVPGPAESQDQADSLFRQGNALYKERQYADAKVAFERAFRMKRTHDIAANLAYTEMKLGLFRDAAEHLSVAVKVWPPTGKDDKRQYAVERLAAAKKEVATLNLQVNVQRAEVFVDGKSIGLWPLEDEVFVEPGARVIEAKLSGYANAKQAVEAAKGAAQTVTLKLAAIAGAAPTDGSGSGPPLPPPGGGRDSGGVNKTILVVGVVTAGVVLGVGIVLAAASASKTADARDQMDKLRQLGDPDPCQSRPGDCDAIEATLRAHDRLIDGAVASFIGAGALAAATAAYGLLPRSLSSPKKAVQVRVLPAVTALQGGVIVQGVW